MSRRFNSRLTAVAVLACTILATELSAAVNIPRPYQPERLVLTLGDQFAGYLTNFEGGDVGSEVRQFSSGEQCFPEKILGPVHVGEIRAEAAIPLAPALYDWIRGSLECDPPRRDGAAGALPPSGAPGWALRFHRGLISEIALPTLDAQSREPALLKFSISPEGIEPGQIGPLPLPAPQPRMSPATSFRLEIPGVDTSAVLRIELPAIQREIREYRDGGSRVATKIPGRIEYPNLRVYIPLSRAQSWFDWHRDFVVNGNSGPDNRKQGIITLFGPDGAARKATISIHGIGINKIEMLPAIQKPITVRAELFCTTIEYFQP